MYSITCSQGHAVSIGAERAGESVACSFCGVKIDVPPLSALKRQAGDRNPYLGAWEKLRLYSNEPVEASATCANCKTTAATVVVPIRFKRLLARAPSDEIVALLPLCNDCRSKFRSSFRVSITRIVIEIAFLAAFIGLVIMPARREPWFDPWLALITLAIVISFGVGDLIDRLKVDSSLGRGQWARKIPHAAPVLDTEEQVALSVEKAVARWLTAGVGLTEISKISNLKS